MESRRQKKIASQLQEIFGKMLSLELKSLIPTGLVTLTYVTITPDLSLARFNLSVMGVEPKSSIIDTFNENKGEIRGILGRKMNSMRKIPNIEFYLDDRLDYVEHMEEVFKKL